MMRTVKFNNRAITIVAVLAALTILAPTTSGNAGHILTEASGLGGQGAQLVIPMMNPALGKKIFIDKGCVACHAVNGVGGHDAPAMDAHREMGLVNPFDFAAKMWNHAPGMIAAQEGAFGEQIYFTGSELAHMIAFLHDEGAQ
ncbi:MAG TPA: c-type cytochrome, partial [Rhodospirillales bacterium]|nr:c-type cytochrome [Rhodospirillales bacterium]